MNTLDIKQTEHIKDVKRLREQIINSMMIDYEKFRMFGEDSKAIRGKKSKGLRVENRDNDKENNS